MKIPCRRFCLCDGVAEIRCKSRLSGDGLSREKGEKGMKMVENSKLGVARQLARVSGVGGRRRGSGRRELQKQ